MAHPASSAPELAARTHLWQVLTSYAIKWIAIVTMVLDHTAAILVWDAYTTTLYATGRADAQLWYDLYTLMRHIGRIAFPLFCFLLAEGFAHTHSRPKYAWRLFLFALISEWPYDFALYGTGIEFTAHQNVMFTLLVGFLALWGGEAVGQLVDRGIARMKARRSGTTAALGAHSPAPSPDAAAVSAGVRADGTRTLTLPTILATIVFVLAGAWVADVTEMSYHAFGVLLIGALYLGRGKPWLQLVLGSALVGWYCWDHADLFEIYAVIGLALLPLYNGRRGPSMKWFFYVFYPAHLLILALIERLVF